MSIFYSISSQNYFFCILFKIYESLKEVVRYPHNMTKNLICLMLTGYIQKLSFAILRKFLDIHYTNLAKTFQNGAFKSSIYSQRTCTILLVAFRLKITEACQRRKYFLSTIVSTISKSHDSFLKFDVFIIRETREKSCKV